MNKKLPKTTSVDRRVKMYKAVAGLIPGGSFIVEYLIDRIPDQRAKRLENYIENINARLEKLEDKNFMSSYEYASLVENSIVEATKPISEKRLIWISSIVVPESPPSLLEIEFRRKALQMLSDLSDGDVECLVAHLDFATKIEFERDMSERHAITISDAKTLPTLDLFRKRLENLSLEIYQAPLIEKRLISVNKDRSFEGCTITNLGRLFLYVLGEESSVR